MTCSPTTSIGLAMTRFSRALNAAAAPLMPAALQSATESVEKKDTSQRQIEHLANGMRNSYIHICLGLAAIAFLFPIAVLLNGWLFGIELQPTISNYYFAPGVSNPPADYVNPGRYKDPWDHPARPLFVGILFTLGIFLFLYKGFTRRENAILNLAGVLALGVAILPMDRMNFFVGIRPYGIDVTPHLSCGFTMFACMTYISFHGRRNTIELFKNPKLRDRMSLDIDGWDG